MQYDVSVIGAGPGGYVAAIRAAQLGFKTAIIERYPTLGGTCLNVGCIPSKALLDSSEHFFNAQKHFTAHGIEIKNLQLNFPQMIARKQKVVDENVSGIAFLMKKNKIDVYHGHGSFVDKNTISIKKDDGETVQIQSKNVIIATGSKPASLPFIEIDKKRIITSTEALSLDKLPKSMIVIGGGVIGLELGSVYARLGTKVSVVEYFDTLIPAMDHSLGKEIQKVLQKELGMEFLMKTKVTAVKATAKKVNVEAQNAEGKTVSLDAEYCLVAVGRKPYTEGLGLENIGLTPNAKGQIPVNEHLETTVSGIFAIGDVIEGAMLAHKAEEEGILVTEYLAGQKPHINYLLIPNVVYTWPEVAAVGYTESQLKEQNRAYKIGNFPFKASGRARASMDTAGFIKVLADAQTDEILGVHMIGPRVADIIAEAVVAMEFRASAEDIGRTCHAHPTYSEAFKEACLAASANRAIHI
ncbi:MAG: dihydrolipoyl dehydrogenase [Chitinophagales bacterium]|nr:dihydrolipoyl dehydrogenase [Bacteroidota bacterium]MCB9043380.1 dihydrolipoyl dehydrogenase [Chitinophagales bacterium]